MRCSRGVINCSGGLATVGIPKRCDSRYKPFCRAIRLGPTEFLTPCGKRMVPRGVWRIAAFSLIELLVVISIIALLIAILLPSLTRARELANRAVCAANVRGIGQAMLIYAQSNHGQFPCVLPPVHTRYQNGPGAAAADNAASITTILRNEYGGNAWQRGSPMACLWLLVISGQITPKSFICPSDVLATASSEEYSNNSTYYSNFGVVLGTVSHTGQGESYSISFPWNYRNGAYIVGSWWNTNVATAQLPLVCDMAPAEDTAAGGNMRRVPTAPLANSDGNFIFNSGNHNGTGQNVGFGDTHVVWATDPYVGEDGDNIFTYASTGGVAGGGTALTPAGFAPDSVLPTVAPFDTVMTPVRDVATGAW
ncbi:MAG: type II secretion system protein [Phycisphaerae bacterium]